MGVRSWFAWFVTLLFVITGAAAAAESTYGELCSSTGFTGSDVCAWLEIPSAGLCLPVMQHEEDTMYYLSHDASGKENPAGALYTEVTHNAKSFSDPVTVIFGGNMSDEAPFGMLQEWYSGAFDAHSLIRLYLPDGVKEYTAFAAVPFGGEHILSRRDFQYERVFNLFFDDVFSVRRPGVQLREALKPEPGEPVIILSTNLMGDTNQRYLVMAKLNH